MSIKAVIFDMDGVLIDSEPLWFKVETRIYRKLGFSLSPSMYDETIGMRYDQVVRHWFKKFPWENFPVEAVQKLIIEKVKKIINKEGKLNPGAKNLLHFLKKENVKIGLASSSPKQIINTVLKKLIIKQYFRPILSGEFESHPKPHPDIFLSAAKKLKVKPKECLVIEDSVFGVTAAKKASMKCVALVKNTSAATRRKYQADYYLTNLADFDRHFWLEINQC